MHQYESRERNMYQYESNGQLTMLDTEAFEETEVSPKQRAVKPDSALIAIPYFHLNLSPDHVDLFGCHFWELRSPWRDGKPPLNTGVAPREPIRVSLSEILEQNPDPKYYLSQTACRGILRRSEERNKELPSQLKKALMIQSGLAAEETTLSDTPIAFAANQRDEVRDLHDVAGALAAQPGMKQQTFVAEGFLNAWDTQQQRVFTPNSVAPTLAGADGGGGRNPAGLLLTETTKASPSGTNIVPSVLCLNDQGGQVMECSENICGTLRAQEHGHQPLVYENHGIDARYTGPHSVVPTMSARYGTGGNNVPLVEQEPVYCIVGNVIDRQPKNGGNGKGYQENIAYTLTAMDHHAVFSRQRVDVFKDGDVCSTQSARQHKDATDLVMDVAGLDCRNASENGDLCGTLTKGSSGTSLNSIHPIRSGLLIRRLTPLECERLQGFPDAWTNLPGASDSARYKALGNSVAIPCVEFLMRGLALALRHT
ncbi:MAG: DNA cytosine methyltransferase [Oscillospiraceae bacterium]|nr:DNA cytosine methyltransferase [Oscillospiraceae bacterium]